MSLNLRLLTSCLVMVFELVARVKCARIHKRAGITINTTDNGRYMRSLTLDADHLSRITPANADSLYAKFMASMPQGKEKSTLVIQNVPTATKERTTLNLVCSYKRRDDGYYCNDPCSITLTFKDIVMSGKGGVNQRWCYIESILYYTARCKSGMPNFGTEFKGKQMVSLAIGLCEHAGYSHQYLNDGAKFPCGKKTHVKINAQTIGLFTQGYSYYMKQGFFPLSQNAAMKSAQKDWCLAKQKALAATVDSADPIKGSPSKAAFLRDAANVLGVSQDALKPMNLGQVYKKIFEKLTPANEEELCDVMEQALSQMDKAVAMGNYFNGPGFKIFGRFSFGFERWSFKNNKSHITSPGVQKRVSALEESTTYIMSPGDDYHEYCD